ncbi:hypothetical protein SARC_09235 [Sphaeroforma arctica JP610]|uniref:LicD/FKTN/FKRP nucleotidyltransferase domain-containing protein n=1 Tax=Sphaeroforma arctica JP610 TaxID=667725 RepID=A0A0L0FNE8_9EUKA|nr:hypothetical protein SARC_09235 [Sphaeroforma arctica JP610]KNC78330.1 hypothetical protein SARC_09235 [Sphaeroforma arctica JP610]|eukprot:XP_014152232.1 hypothetical protein SARC_09235 [Sphaeroforma arctica JP610]
MSLKTIANNTTTALLTLSVLVFCWVLYNYGMEYRADCPQRDLTVDIQPNTDTHVNTLRLALSRKELRLNNILKELREANEKLAAAKLANAKFEDQIQAQSELIQFQSSIVPDELAMLHTIPRLPFPEPRSDTARLVSKELINNLKVGKSPANEIPSWISKFCPEVIEHFNAFPLFANMPEADEISVTIGPMKGHVVPIQSSEYAIRTTCELKVGRQVAAQVGSPYYIYAGTQLGGILHAGPIPWDDDADVAIPVEYKKRFVDACNSFTIPDTTLDEAVVKCVETGFGVKLMVVDRKSQVHAKYGWSSPFVDVFLMDEVNGTVRELHANATHGREMDVDHETLSVREDGLAAFKVYPSHEFYPVRPYYYGGLVLQGPSISLATNRYNLRVCRMGVWNHHFEISAASGIDGQLLDCEFMAQYLPFVQHTVSEVDGDIAYSRLSINGTDGLIHYYNARTNQLGVVGRDGHTTRIA